MTMAFSGTGVELHTKQGGYICGHMEGDTLSVAMMNPHGIGGRTRYQSVDEFRADLQGTVWLEEEEREKLIRSVS